MMHRVLLLGAGKIGRMIARLLVDSGDYAVTVGDVSSEALDRIAARVPGVQVRVVDVAARAYRGGLRRRRGDGLLRTADRLVGGG